VLVLHGHPVDRSREALAPQQRPSRPAASQTSPLLPALQPPCSVSASARARAATPCGASFLAADSPASCTAEEPTAVSRKASHAAGAQALRRGEQTDRQAGRQAGRRDVLLTTGRRVRGAAACKREGGSHTNMLRPALSRHPPRVPTSAFMRMCVYVARAERSSRPCGWRVGQQHRQEARALDCARRHQPLVRGALQQLRLGGVLRMRKGCKSARSVQRANVDVSCRQRSAQQAWRFWRR
jgi:hypothetical protein